MTMQSNSFVRRRSIRAATALALGLPLLLSGLAGPAAAAPSTTSTTIQNSPLAEVPELYQDGHYIVMLEAQLGHFRQRGVLNRGGYGGWRCCGRSGQAGK